MKSIFFLLTAVLFWALNFYLGSFMMEYVSPNLSAFWRYIFGVATLLLLTYKKLPNWLSIIKNWKGILLVGLIGLFGFIYLFFQGLKYTSAMNGSLIISLNPATTLLLTIILQGYKPDTRQITGIILAFSGVLYLLTSGQIENIHNISFNKGDVLFFFANIAFAFNTIWVKKYAMALGNKSFTTLTSIVCLIAFIPIVAYEATFPLKNLPPEFWLAGIGMGVFGTALAYYCWNYGVSKIGAAKGAVFLNVLPLFSAVFAVIFGAELFSYHVISSLLIIGGLLLVQINNVKNSNKIILK